MFDLAVQYHNKLNQSVNTEKSVLGFLASAIIGVTFCLLDATLKISSLATLDEDSMANIFPIWPTISDR